MFTRMRAVIVVLLAEATWGWSSLVATPQSVPRGEPACVEAKRTFRTRFVEACFRGWLRDAQRRGWLRLGSLQEVAAIEPASCDATSRRCPDVVRVSARDVRWGKHDDVVRFAGVEAEVVNLHRRVLSRGRHGSIKARLTLRGQDLDGSAIWRQQLGNLLERLLRTYLRDDVEDLRLSTVVRDGTIGVAGNFTGGTFRLVTSLQPTRHGAVALRNVKLELPGRLSVAETIGELYLSTVDLESPFEVTDIVFHGDRLVATFVSGDHYLPAGVADEWKSVPVFPAVDPRSFFVFDLPRTTFVLGDRLPWVLNAKNAAPRLVVIAFAALALALKISSLPDELWTLAVQPALALKRAVLGMLPVCASLALKATHASKSFVSLTSAAFVSVLPTAICKRAKSLTAALARKVVQLKNFFFSDIDNKHRAPPSPRAFARSRAHSSIKPHHRLHPARVHNAPRHYDDHSSAAAC